MIIDVHTHVGCDEMDFPVGWPEGGQFTYRNLVQVEGALEAEDAEDPTGERALAEMARLGIEKAVLLPMDFNLIGKDRYRTRADLLPRTPIAETLERFGRIQAAHPDKFIAFASIDPRRGEEGLKLFRRAVEEWGLRGLKLHSSAGYYLNDRATYPYYELCCEYDIPLLCHAGFEFPPGRVKFCDPADIDEVAGDFPGMRIIVAHVGGHGHGPASHFRATAISMACVHPNLYLDVADLQCIYVKEPVDFYRSIRKGLTWAPDKLLFGTDSPWLDAVLPTEVYIDAFRNPDPVLLDRADVEFSGEEIDNLMFGNALRALKLEG